MDVSYPAPVDQLLSLGDPDQAEGDLGYRTLGISDEHVPVLIEMMRDERLNWIMQALGEDETPFWAPVHAWRALGELRAQAAVPAMVAHLADYPDSEWTTEDIPEVLARMGASALGPVGDALVHAADEGNADLFGMLAHALRRMAGEHPPLRDTIMDVFVERMAAWERQDPESNAWVVAALLDLHATEAPPGMQAAFEAGKVDESVCGDWEDAQVELGLLEKRITPRPQFRIFGRAFEDILAPPPKPKPMPIPGSDSAAAKARTLRKAQKKSKKRRR
ncbi:hypothetical protein [Longimicrobium sp.]|uniref:hypothetical protein n=1 Tax=Longimicrobium sp. TaxID=2029185 RepID=UPI002E324F72|nr:hypothetical protein [Longimicrobium sp.]HEX6037996.1 hypothetical protein [Longimicrobium sp.]